MVIKIFLLKMKKIGLLCLALVLALGALGVGYAHWTDTVYINQIVETGSVKVGVYGVATDPVEYEEKDVCQVTVNHDTYKFDKEIEPGDLHMGSLIGPGIYSFYESVTVNITNYYPGLTILEDFYIGNAGSIPVKLNVNMAVVDPDGVYDYLRLSWRVDYNGQTIGSGVGNNATAEFPEIIALVEGMQLHECDVVTLWMDKTLLQEAPQDVSASFMMIVGAVPWNLYVY